MLRRLPALVVLVASSLAPSIARADIAPIGASACDGKAVGAACETFGVTNGVCTQTTCSKLDYSNGTPPTTKSYSCVRCLARPAKPPPPKDAGAPAPSASNGAASAQPSSDPAPSSSTPPATSSAPSATSAPAPTPSTASTPAPTSAPAAEPKKQGGCHAGAVGASGADVLVTVGALAVVVARRRRRAASR